MSDRRQRIAEFVTRRTFSDTTRPDNPPARMSFADWSRQAGTKPLVWPEPPPRPLGVVTRVIPAIYPWQPIHIEIGNPYASITLNRALIRHPEPFDANGLTDACRAFIVEAVKAAVERDGLRRAITWPDQPSADHGEQHG